MVFFTYCSKIKVIDAIPFSVSSTIFFDDSTSHSILNNNTLLASKISSYIYTSGTDSLNISLNADSKDTPGNLYSYSDISWFLLHNYVLSFFIIFNLPNCYLYNLFLEARIIHNTRFSLFIFKHKNISNKIRHQAFLGVYCFYHKTTLCKGWCLIENSIYQSGILNNQLKQLNLCRIFPYTVVKHVLAILISVFSSGYHGKTKDFETYSPCHRTTVAHFLNKGV